MYYNWAIIAPKDSTATAISATEFLRGNGISRNQAFDTTLSGSQMHCLPINTDKFTVLEHKRFRLNTSTGPTYTNEDGSSYMNFNKYVPVNRQLRYKNNSNDPTQGDIWMVHWASGYMQNTGTAVATNAYRQSESIVTYFKEPGIA
jgi:hypothetical protein